MVTAAIPPEERALREQLAASQSACIRAADETRVTAQKVTRVLDEAKARRTAERRVLHDAACTEACCAEKEKS